MGTCGGRRTRSAKDWRVYYRLKQREWRAAHPPLPRPRARRRRKQKLPAPTVRLDFNHLADAMLANAR
jgi:CRISPR/Cas system endoribonuclease Cas6 (RAMP superfamily)